MCLCFVFIYIFCLFPQVGLSCRVILAALLLLVSSSSCETFQINLCSSVVFNLLLCSCVLFSPKPLPTDICLLLRNVVLVTVLFTEWLAELPTWIKYLLETPVGAHLLKKLLALCKVLMFVTVSHRN